MSLLEQHASIIRPDVRRDLCRSVMLMRTKETVQAARYWRLWHYDGVNWFSLTDTCPQRVRLVLQAVPRQGQGPARHVVPAHRVGHQEDEPEDQEQFDEQDVAELHVHHGAGRRRHGRSHVDQGHGRALQEGRLVCHAYGHHASYAHAGLLCRKDARTCNVMAMACFSPHTKVMVAALQFFLGADDLEDNDDSDEVSCSRLSWTPLFPALTCACWPP